MKPKQKIELLRNYGLGILLALIGVFLAISATALYEILFAFLLSYLSEQFARLVILMVSSIAGAGFILCLGFYIEDVGTEYENDSLWPKIKRYINRAKNI